MDSLSNTQRRQVKNQKLLKPSINDAIGAVMIYGDARIFAPVDLLPAFPAQEMNSFFLAAWRLGEMKS